MLGIISDLFWLTLLKLTFLSVIIAEKEAISWRLAIFYLYGVPEAFVVDGPSWINRRESMLLESFFWEFFTEAGSYWVNDTLNIYCCGW